MASSQVEIPAWVSRVAKNKNIGSLNCTKRFHNIFGDKDDSSFSALVSPRHSKIVDLWAARQAQEVVTNLEKNNKDVDKVFDNFSTRSSSFNSRRGRDVSVSPPRSDDSTESERKSNLGASSLVQIWEQRLSQSNCTKPSTPPAIRTNSDSSCNETNACSVEEHSRVSEEGESSDESEKCKVADIIKKLSVTSQMQNDENDHEMSNSVTNSPYKDRNCVSISTPKQLTEHKGFSQVTSSPRIRGRQAFHDLIMQFECDRHGELNNLAEQGAVSKFTQRGRIQSLLRLRLLQRGVAAFDPSVMKSTTPEVNKQQQGSTIMQLREKFNTRDEQISLGRETVKSNTQLDKIHTANEINKDNVCCKKVADIKTKIHSHNAVSKTSADVKEETKPSYVFEARNDDPKETISASYSKSDSNTNETDDKVEEREQQSYDTIETSYNEMLEEKDCSDYDCDETGESYDWASPISRPRSYWEELRQEWYREMLNFSSHNDERRKLLERRTVSTVLSSEFRERMDKLMQNHVGTQTHLVNNQSDEDDQNENMEKLMAFYHDRLRARGNVEEDGKGNKEKEVAEEEEHEHESINSGSDHELSDNQSSPSVHTPSSTTWSYRDNDSADNDSAAFVSSPLPPQSQSFYQDSTQYSSSPNHNSIEMDLIYDLRGQMEQLFREMSELRKTINNCTEMQMQLQQSQNQEVHKVKVKKSSNRTSKKGSCCICNENKINSVLYRCGHMCACFKCASELQGSNKKCPICKVPIIDVVKVYTNTESVHDGQSLTTED